MSVIALFYGQCGNQIGENVFSNIYDDTFIYKKDCDYFTSSLNRWFYLTKRNKLESRSVFVDTEMKTVPKRTNLPYQIKNIVSKTCGGSANNWAFGYLEQGKLLANDIMNCVRKECERSDDSSSFLNVFSSSGGTGSGVGSLIIEKLRNEFPNKIITNLVVLPRSSGELAVQSYNSLLTMAKIYSESDSILAFENDRLHYNCVNSLGLSDVSYDDMNNIISRQLLGLYQPLKDEHPSCVLSELCTESNYKLLQLKSALTSKSERSHCWKSLLTSISRQSRFDFQQQNSQDLRLKSRNVSTAFISRGRIKPEEKDLVPLLDSNHSKSFQTYYDKRKLFNLENSLTIVSNGNSIYIPLKTVQEDAWNLYKYGAYLHHYEKFGIEKCDFKTSFDTLGTVLENYKNL